MINNLFIQRFKSVKELSIDCKRINLFIGEPNTGKSNILEALGLISWVDHKDPGIELKKFVRMQNVYNLFYDNIADKPLLVKIDGKMALHFEMSFDQNKFNLIELNNPEPLATFNFEGKWLSKVVKENYKIDYYRYDPEVYIGDLYFPTLLTPDGINLFSVAYSSKENRELVSQFYKPYGLKAVFKPQDRSIEIQKQVDDIVVSYPYSMSSDTLRRMIFYLLSIRSNKNAVLVFEEPESHAFPYYTKYLGEMIAADSVNQYFIATHNPYLLYAIVEKANKDDVNVCITYYRDFQTKVKQLSQNELELLLDQDPFLSINQFIGE